MGLTILQLTDLHLEDDSQIEDKEIELFASAVKTKYDTNNELVLCFTGDLTKGGSKQQYKVFKKLMGRIVEKLSSILSISKEKINTYIIPGNHDIEFEEGYTDDVSYMKKNFNNIINLGNYKRRMNNFFHFAKTQLNMFTNNEFVDKRIINIDGFNVGLFFLNTAYNSFYSNNADKAYHFLNKEAINSLNDGDCNLSIMFMHHPISWFHGETAFNLNKTIRDNYSFVFEGHEHYSRQGVNYEGRDYYSRILTGEFVKKDVSKKEHLNSFSIIDIDLILKKYKYSLFEFDINDDCFIETTTYDENFELKSKKNRFMNLDDDFEDEVLVDSLTGNKISDMFIFPDLDYDMLAEDSSITKKTVNTINKFEEIVSNKSIITLSGNEYVGKSIFLKYLFMRYLNKGFLPILLDRNSIQKTKVGQEDKIFKRAFVSEYKQDNSSISKYEQCEYKVAFIDDFESIENKDKLLEAAKKKFNKIYIFQNSSFELETPKENVEKLIDNNSEAITFEIQSMTRIKRKELIKGLCVISGKFSDSIELNEKVEKIENFIFRQSIAFKTDPIFIINLANCFLKDSNFNNDNAEINSFSDVFVASLVDKIKLYLDDDKIDIATSALSYIAYYCHHHRVHPIDQDIVFKCIKDYLNDYEIKIDANELFDAFIKSKILKKSMNNQIRFSTKYYFAYFVARRLQIIVSEDIELGRMEMSFLLSNIFKGANTEILIYLSYLYNDPRILERILEGAKNNLFDFETIDLNDKKYNFLYTDKNVEIQEPTEEEKKETDGGISDLEKEELEYHNVQVVDFCNYSLIDESKITPEIRRIRAYKYLEILGKTFSNRFYHIKGGLKKKFIDEIFVEPAKILKADFDFIADNYHDIYSGIEKFIDEQKKIDKEFDGDIDIKFMISAVCWLRMALTLEKSVKFFANNRTIEYIEEAKLEENIINDLQKYFAYSKINGMTKFFEYGALIYNRYKKNKMVSTVIREYARIVILVHNIKRTSSNRNYIDTIFQNAKSKMKHEILSIKGSDESKEL